MPDVPLVMDEPSSRPRRFADRRSAGRALAQALIAYAGIVRKLGAPMQPELGMGAIAEGPAVVLDRYILGEIEISRAELLEIARREMGEVRRRVDRFRGGGGMPELDGRIVILVDDGIATGGTIRAAIRAVRKRHPKRLIVAVPVASPEVVDALGREADEVVCLQQPSLLYAIGLWYEEFEQVPDEEVARILGHAARPAAERTG